MTRAVIGSALRLGLTPEEAAHLAKEFCSYKDGESGPGDYFGKDTAFARPKSVVDLGIRKIHLETPDVTPAWNRMIDAEVQERNKYTSDKILVYVHLGDVQGSPYLLLTILEPGHEKMSNPDLVRGLAILCEDERSAYAKTYPGPQWISEGK